MVMQNKAIICDLYVLINSHASNMHANKQLVNREHWSLNCYLFWEVSLTNGCRYSNVFRMKYISTSHSICCYRRVLDCTRDL